MARTIATYEGQREEFSRQRELRLKKITHLEKALEDSTIDVFDRRLIQDRIDRCRRYLGNTVSRRWEDIEQRASDNVNLQIEQYDERHGEGAWDGRYQPFWQLPRDEQAETLVKMKNSKGMRAMLLWSDPMDYLRPRKAPWQIEVDGVIFDPGRISEDMAEHFGAQFDEKDERNPKRRMIKKEAAIPKIREAVNSSQPIHSDNFRILILPDGHLLYSSEESGDDECSLTHLSAGIYDAYGAYRKTFHEEQAYQKEISGLVDKGFEIEKFNLELDAWRAETPEGHKQRLREETRRRVLEWQTFFRSCKNRYKLTARELLGDIINLSDKRGHTNISSCMAKMVGAVGQLDKRVGTDIRPKTSYNAQDRHDLYVRIQHHERRLREFRTWLLHNWKNVLETKSLKGAPSLKGIHMQPFKLYSDSIIAMMAGLSDALNTSDETVQKNLLVATHVIGKLFCVRACFAKMYNEVIDAAFKTAGCLRERFIGPLRGHFAERQVLENHEVQGFKDPFERMKDDLEVIDGMIAQMPDDEEITVRHTVYMAVRKYLEENSPESALDKLPIQEMISGFSA